MSKISRSVSEATIVPYSCVNQCFKEGISIELQTIVELLVPILWIADDSRPQAFLVERVSFFSCLQAHRTVELVPFQ